MWIIHDNCKAKLYKSLLMSMYAEPHSAAFGTTLCLSECGKGTCWEAGHVDLNSEGSILPKKRNERNHDENYKESKYESGITFYFPLSHILPFCLVGCANLSRSTSSTLAGRNQQPR